MYVVTFYSFKGGTGRSMTLMNVAADLLSRGRRVLIVDFDLEAPGLETFPIELERPIDRGLVEMILEYQESATEAPPPLSQFVYPAKITGLDTGNLWIMPAGMRGRTYEHNFKSIDWLDFYRNQGGFLFFEDLKAQWKEFLNPDYVLVDSRTGHTDIGGICTRQLPDSVVVMFYPNEQNLRGLVPTVQEIRSEETGPLKKKIDLHFVMGNVPDLDDEDQILSQIQRRFSDALGYEELSATIHHLVSFSMLVQNLAILERPKSKIASEYRTLASSIVNRNLEDRAGAKSLIEKLFHDFALDYESVNDVSEESRLQFIQGHHWNDIEIIRDLAKIRRVQRRTEEALDLFERVLAINKDDAEGLLGRAEVLTFAKRSEEAVDDLLDYFKLTNIPVFSFPLATRLLMINDKSKLGAMTHSPAIVELPGVIAEDVLSALQREFETCVHGAEFAETWLREHTEEKDSSVFLEFTLCLIAAGEFGRAMELLGPKVFAKDASLPDVFNFIMAEWGASKTVPRDLFETIFLPKIEEPEAETGPNRLQCFALAYWAVGDTARAQSLYQRALEEITDAPRSEFSAWTYLYRSPKDFVGDLQAMKAMIDKDVGRPEFLERSRFVQ